MPRLTMNGTGIACFGILLSSLSSSAKAQAPSTATRIETGNGLHTVTFTAPAGSVRAYFPDDASAGDTITGAVLAEPAGSTPEQKQQNMDELTGIVVEFQDQRKNVKDKTATWMIPAEAAATAIVIFRDRIGNPVGQTPIPIAPRSPSEDRPVGFMLPELGQSGHPGTIRGPFDGNGRTTSLRIGNADMVVLAESPRQAIFVPPTEDFGLKQIELRKGDTVARGTFRNTGVRLSATKLALVRGQTAVLTITILGLQDIKEPIQAILTNASPSVVKIEGGVTQLINASPSRVRADGTYSETKTITGIQSGSFSVNATVRPIGGDPAELAKTADGVLDRWQESTGIKITAAAHVRIRDSVIAERINLDRLTSVQPPFESASNSFLSAIVRAYCFELRDQKIRDSARLATPVGLGHSAAFRSAGNAPSMPTTIEVADVDAVPFKEYLASMDNARPKAYLDLYSKPTLAEIYIDKRHLGYTDRSAVVESGKHTVKIVSKLASLNCTRDVQLEPGSALAVNCPE